MLSILRAAMVLFIPVLAAGCASNSTRTASHSKATGSSSTVLTAQELTRTGTHDSIMDALERLRPLMLVGRAATPWVSIDGSPPLELSVLRTIQSDTVREVRLQRISSSVGPTLVTPNGSVIAGGDLIVVTTWQGRRER